MRLRRLELYGCKSFATRTVFEFSEGITAIVGPNGSGKSNIADAVRWVLGEQSFSSLRAKSTEDMIFAGSRTRPRLSVAEVIITFDNSTHWLPLDFTEVAIGRRAYRSGENEYLLNGNRVRYRDVLELLGAAGLACNTYVVIGQGMVDAALALRPEARRVLFEEAAGIGPHLRKRAESLKRIEETERNLERVGDILNELRQRVGGLRQQAERAEEYRQVSKELRRRQQLWYGYQWQRRQRLLAQAEESLREGIARLELQRAHVRSFEQKQGEFLALQEAQRRLVTQLTVGQNALQAQMEARNRELMVLDERMRLYQIEREALESELQSLGSRQMLLEAEIERVRQDMAACQVLCSSEEVALDEARTQLAQWDASRRETKEQLEAEEVRLSELAEALVSARARLEGMSERRQALFAEQERLRATLSELESRLEALKAEEERLKRREGMLDEQILESEEQLRRLRAEAAAVQEQLSSAEADLAKARAERERLIARRATLSQLREELTGYYPGVREVLNAKLPGLLGTVASLIQVPRELEQAIESALGPRLQHIVTERWEDAEAAIRHLKHVRGGWATFLPLDAIRSRPSLVLRAEPGIVGVASTLVSFEERLRRVVELLLGTVVIVRDLSVARRLLAHRTGATLFVTLEGETVQPNGTLSGGSRREGGGLLAQEREWRTLPQRIAAVEEALARASEVRTKHEEALALLTHRIQEQERRCNDLRTEREATRVALKARQQEMSGVERERSWQAARLSRNMQAVMALDEEEQRLRNEIEAGEATQRSWMERLHELRQRLNATDDAKLRQRVAELETQHAVSLRTLQSLGTLLESHRSNLDQLLKQISEKRARHAVLTEELQQAATRAEAIRGQLLELEQRSLEHSEHLVAARQELDRLEREHQEAERQLSKGRERLNELEGEVNRLVLERDRAKGELATLIREIEADLGPVSVSEETTRQLRLDFGDEVVELPVVNSLPPGLAEEIQQFKARLRRLGDINFSAPQEYRQLLERQAFLESQANDLRNAITALRAVIQELDRVIERDFLSTVKTVDRLFAEIFSRLFSGGSARLVLTDPENPGTTGVEIIVHPPGKRAQSLSLLSGGERALTGVALLFALLRANPVPFCFLDEVDAALDEANVVRFRELLQEQAKLTQLVVITHNRYTIEAASTIYGISMNEQGVSQSISLKLGEKQPEANYSEEVC